MPRYTFNLTDGEDFLENPRTLELAGKAAAREEAVMLARDLKHRRLMSERDWDGWFVSICDEQGREVDSIPITDAPEVT